MLSRNTIDGQFIQLLHMQLYITAVTKADNADRCLKSTAQSPAVQTTVLCIAEQLAMSYSGTNLVCDALSHSMACDA